MPNKGRSSARTESALKPDSIPSLVASAAGWSLNEQVETSGSLHPNLCMYTVRVKRSDGTEELLARRCPYFVACESMGMVCAGAQQEDLTRTQG